MLINFSIVSYTLIALEKGLSGLSGSFLSMSNPLGGVLSLLSPTIANLVPNLLDLKTGDE